MLLADYLFEKSAMLLRIESLFLLLAFVACVSAAENGLSDGEHNSAGCDCMEYWTCVMSGGNPYSYCGLSEATVCCFVPDNAVPVGLLPDTSPGKRRCGQKGAGSGQDGVADVAEWPWHAAILEKPDDLYVCGASLLDENWVLTAAHCVDDYVGGGGSDLLKVRLGEYDVSSTSERLRHEELDVLTVVLYPSFDNASLAHDIALLRLRRPAKRRPNIDVVCLPKLESRFPDTRTSPRAKCVVTGWGRRTEGSDHSVVLKEVTVPLWEDTVCQTALRQQFGAGYSLPVTSMCAGGEGQDACDGDGGGPLVCEKDGQWYQVGVVSFGIGCGRRNTPGVYTRVNMYERWITETVLFHKQL